MFTTYDFILLIIVIAVPVICSLTMGKNGTFTETKKVIATYGVSLIATAYYMYSIQKDIISGVIETVVGALLFGSIGYFIVSYFDKIWAEQEYTKKELEKQEARNRELREELRNKE